MIKNGTFEYRKIVKACFIIMHETFHSTIHGQLFAHAVVQRGYFYRKILLKILLNFNSITKTLLCSFFLVNFEGKVRTTASDVIGNIISIFLVYENLKPNNSKVLKADFCVYVLFFFYPEFSLSLEELYTCKVLKLCYE